MSTVSLNCNRCGAPVDIERGTRNYQCGSCGSRLSLQRNDTAIYTKTLEEIDKSTRQAEYQISLLRMYQNLIREDISFVEESTFYVGRRYHPWLPRSGFMLLLRSLTFVHSEIVCGVLLVALNLFAPWPPNPLLSDLSDTTWLPLRIDRLAGVCFWGYLLYKAARHVPFILERKHRLRSYWKYYDGFRHREILLNKKSRLDAADGVPSQQRDEAEALVTAPCTKCGCELQIPAGTSYVFCRQCRSNISVRKSARVDRQSYAVSRRFRKIDADVTELNQQQVWKLFNSREEALDKLETFSGDRPGALTPVWTMIRTLIRVGPGLLFLLAVPTQWGCLAANIGAYFILKGVNEFEASILIDYLCKTKRRALERQEWKIERAGDNERLRVAVESMLTPEEIQFWKDPVSPTDLSEIDSRHMKKLLKHISKKLGPRPRRIHETPSGESFTIDRVVEWRKFDDINQYHDEVGDAVAEGYVTWGALVMANMMSFGWYPFNTIGVVVYSREPGQYVSPDKLQQIGGRLFSERFRSSSKDPQIREIGRLLDDEMERFFDLPVPRDYCRGLNLSVSCIVFERCHLPNAVLSRRTFPLLVKPTEPRIPMVVPSDYWPRALVEDWLLAEEMHKFTKEELQQFHQS